MQKAIIVEKLTKKYRSSDKYAVDGISFKVNEGSFISFLGPNGAGKTTTISILTTLLTKSGGKVSIAGFDLDDNPNQIRKNIGIIFQKPSLDLNLTAEENLRFHAILYGLYPFRPTFPQMPQAYQEKITELTNILNISDSLHKPIKTLSGGMKRKFEILRSLMHHPAILFLDEPTAGLDPQSRKALWEYIHEVNRLKKTTVFLTTHNLEETEHSDQVIIIKNGKLLYDGSPQKLKNNLIENYLVIESKKKNQLIEELNKLNIAFIEKDSKIKISLEKYNTQKLIKIINTPLSSIKTHTPTMEEAYLEIIEGSNVHSE